MERLINLPMISKIVAIGFVLVLTENFLDDADPETMLGLFLKYVFAIACQFWALKQILHITEFDLGALDFQ